MSDTWDDDDLFDELYDDYRASAPVYETDDDDDAWYEQDDDEDDYPVCRENVPPMTLETEALMDAAKKGDVESLRRLLAAGVDVNALGGDGQTALIVATHAARLGAMEVLAAANPTVQPTVLDYDEGLCRAARNNDVKAIEAMLNHGAHMENPVERGKTALMVATECGCMEAIDALMAAGANVNCKNIGQETPLMRAAWRGDLELVQRVLKWGADVNASKTDGTTALMIAVESGYEDVVEELLKAGANVDQADMHDRTAMSTAISNEYWKIMDLLDKYRHSSLN